MSRIPFTVYDFFAYLSSGGLLVAAVDSVFGEQWILQNQLGLGRGALLLLVAYVAGHLVAHFSAFLLEQVLVERVLKRPSRILVGETPPKWLGKIFPGYYRVLPAETQGRIRKRAEQNGVPTSGEALFLHAYASMAKDSGVQARLDEFRNLYGFARNMALALIATGVLLAIGTALHQVPDRYGWSILSGMFGVAMVYRYLKFFRQFSYQLFIAYAELGPGREGEQ